MIVYDPFWKTLRDRNLTTYRLIKDYNISSSTISRLRNNKGISTTTIDDICKILNCNVDSVLLFVNDPLPLNDINNPFYGFTNEP